MPRTLAALVVAFALATASASAATFAVVPEPAGPVTGPLVLPSAETPNETASLLLPPGVWETPFLPVRELSQEELQALWARAGAAYGIPWQVLGAINEIETNFGRNMGPSSAGAVGWMQFMPDTWLRWGMDGNGDGIADPWGPEDAVFAAARYLAAAGGREDLRRGIFAYNRAQWYVDDVLELAALFGDGADVVFTLDRMALDLRDAEAQAAALTEELARAEELERRAIVRATELAAGAADLGILLSDRLPLEQDAFQAAQERDTAAAEVQRLRDELARAQEQLERARSDVRASSFAPAAAGVLGMPSRADGYVFPVGGGPEVVSVGRDHNNYPAADIAAPFGTPLYALADAVVLSLADDDRCGIGFTLHTQDGLEWVYCHLSYRDPALQPGSVLAAGQWVGRVGSTGRSTGPHLHLGLQPARYPQEMPWFLEFAGIAFRWQDGSAPSGQLPGPVFAVVPTSPDPPNEVVEFTLTGS